MKARCQCGALTAEAPEDARPMTIMCHCDDCRRRSGSPFGSIAYYERDAVTLSGKRKEFTRPTDSGFAFTTGFCPTCGSTVYAVPSRIPTIMGVTVGCIEGEQMLPVLSVYEQGRHDWVAVPDGASRHPRGRDS